MGGGVGGVGGGVGGGVWAVGVWVLFFFF